MRRNITKRCTNPIKAKQKPIKQDPISRKEGKDPRYKALEKKVFYFDFSNPNKASWLEKEIRKLGGKVEYFFSKEVQYFITDKPLSKPGFPPCSPFSNGPSPLFSRPDTSQSTNVGPSPSEWAYSEQWKKPQQSSQVSRGMKMIERASLTKSQGSCDTVTRAREKGVVIKTVEQITAWLDTVHKKLGTKMSQESLKEHSQNPSRKLRGAFLKVQDRAHKYKPQMMEPLEWQTIDCNLLTDESPFSTEKRRVTRKQANELHKPPTDKYRAKGILKDAKDKKPRLNKRKGGGKCEGCNVRFENLDSHLSSDQHMKYAKKEKNFEDIDSLIEDGLSLDHFLSESMARMDERLPWSQRGPMSPDIDGDSTDTLGDGPCTRARRHKLVCNTAGPVPPGKDDDCPATPKGIPANMDPTLENNYFLRSTPRKLLGALDEYIEIGVEHGASEPANVSQCSEGKFLDDLDAQSLDLFSSQSTEAKIKLSQDQSPARKTPLTRSPIARSPARVRGPVIRGSPAKLARGSPSKVITAKESPAKRRCMDG